MTAEDDAAGRRLTDIWYADTFEVGQSGLEFKIDCGHNLYESQPVKEYLRIIAHPIHARELFRRLGRGLIQYADDHGPIADGEPGDPGRGP